MPVGRRGLLTCMASAVAALAGCGAATSVPTQPGGPGSASPAPSSPTRTTTAPCETSQLRLGLGQRVSEATGQHTLSMTLTNVSRSACSLFGYPDVTLADAGGHVLAFRYEQRGDLMITGHAPSRVDVAPGNVAYVTINQYRCDLGDKAVARTLALVPPGSSTPLRLHLPKYPILGYCGAGQPGSTVDISPVEASFQATGSGSGPAAGAVAWLDTPAAMPTTTTTAVPARPACRPQGLLTGRVTTGVAMGSRGWTVVVTNSSTTACSLPGGPLPVTAVDGGGRRVALRDDGSGYWDPITLMPGGRAQLSVQARDFCDVAGRLLPSRHYRSVEVELPGGTIALPGLDLVLCDNEVFAGFMPAAPPPAPRPAPGTLPTLTAHIDSPTKVRAGSTLRYVVVLANPTDTDVALEPCPVYEEFIGGPSGQTRDVLRLNCTSTHAIRAHTEVSYDMVIRVPSPGGRAKFEWSLGPAGPYAGAPLTVVPWH